MNYHYQPSIVPCPERINRLTYFIRGMLFLLGTAIAGGTIGMVHHFTHAADLILFVGGAAFFVLLFVGLFRFVLIPRIRDMGLPRAWAWSLIFFVHSLNFLFLLALLFVPTNAFAKRADYSY